MKFTKKLFIVFIISIFQMNLNAAEIGSKHEYGISLLGSYEYEERKLMYLRAGSQADKDQLENIGFLYNYKNAFLNNKDYVNEFELDASYQFQTQTYNSYGTGTMDDIKVEIYNLRSLYGIQLSEKLMLKTGLGYRYLYHYWQDRHSSTGAIGYDREQNYTYFPILAELQMPIPELDLNGKLKLEYDIILSGNNTSYNAYRGGVNRDEKFENNNGYIWKVSYKGERNGINIEPYYEFMNIDNAIVVNGSLEPANTTKEIGLRLTKVFNSERVASSDHKKLLDNDNYYFGVQLLQTEVESGFSATTGTATIDEKDFGYSIVSGMKLLDVENGNSLNLDVELAYNQFGETILFLNNGDTVVTDGRYRNAEFANGTTLTAGSDNTEVAINGYSTTIGIKPSIVLDNGMFVSASYGFNKWDQSEETSRPGSRDNSHYYNGIDKYHGFGLGINSGNLALSIEHFDHDMYYDASSTSASLKYKF